ncbi:hypothetical protein OIU76_005078 [Salix suchowensis]|nr:hypothetical protein OIU76_005078 [Salix suchowensis]
MKVKALHHQELNMEERRVWSLLYMGGTAPTSYHSQGVYAEAEPMVHSPTHNPGGYLQPPLFAPQYPMAPLPRSGEITQVPKLCIGA